MTLFRVTDDRHKPARSKTEPSVISYRISQSLLGEAPNVLLQQVRQNLTRNFSSPLDHLILYDARMFPNLTSRLFHIPSSESSLHRLPLTFERSADSTDVADVFQNVKELTLGGTYSCPSQLHTKPPVYDRLCDALHARYLTPSPPRSNTDLPRLPRGWSHVCLETLQGLVLH